MPTQTDLSRLAAHAEASCNSTCDANDRRAQGVHSPTRGGEGDEGAEELRDEQRREGPEEERAVGRGGEEVGERRVGDVGDEGGRVGWGRGEGRCQGDLW